MPQLLLLVQLVVHTLVSAQYRMRSNQSHALKHYFQLKAV